MGSRRFCAAAIALLTGTTGLAVGTATPALADSSQPLAITSVGDMVIDGVHERIFISDPTGGKVIATDYSGNQLGSVQVNDADDLALTPDSSQLYVASQSESAIFALDTTTVAQTAKYSTGAVAPWDLAVAGDRIWFSYSKGTHSELGTIDPSTETPTVSLDRYETVFGGSELAAAAGKPNRIGVVSRGTIALLDVSGDTVTEVASTETYNDALEMAISPNGENIATVFPANYGIMLRDVSDLAAARRLPIGTFSTAVDFSADGSLVGGSDDVFGPDLYIFAPSGELIKEITFPDHGHGPGRAVAWEPNSDRVFAISANGTVFRLRSYADTKQSPTTVTLAGLPTAVPGAPVTVTGRLASSLSLSTGTVVGASRNGVSLGTTAVGADGSFSFTDTPPGDGTWTYEFSYAGDDTHLPSTATTSIQVARATSTVIVWGPSTAVPGAPITITGRLTSPYLSHAGSLVSVSRSGTSLGTVTVDSDNWFSFTDTAPGEGTWAYKFAYAGDDTRLPTTATTSVEVSRMASTLTLAGPSSATRAKPLTITGTLASPLPLPTGAKVSISRVDLDHPAGTSLGTRTVGANGSFSFADSPAVGGTVTYQVSYAGDATHSPVAATKSVAVSRTTPALTLTNSGKVYNYGQTVSFAAHLGSTYKNRTVEIWADPNGSDQAKRLLKRGTVNSSGNLTASLKLTRNTTVSAVFTGDARTAPRTVTATVGTKVSLTLKLSKYYKTAKISGTTYRYYHADKSAWFTVSMTSGSQRKVYVQLQRYTKGKWQTWDSQYFDATDSLYLDGSGLTGAKLRVRAAYIKGDSGDSLNTNTWTPYQYLTFTK